MLRLVLLVLIAVPAAAATITDDQRYLRANARLAHATPAYPHARLLVQEAIGGEVGPTPFEAVQRISALARPTTQRQVMRFYARKLGPTWRRRGTACLVSGSKLVVALVEPKRRRLGVLVDSRGADRCVGLQGILGDFLGVGYP
jgi:hypothetical protein